MDIKVKLSFNLLWRHCGISQLPFNPISIVLIALEIEMNEREVGEEKKISDL